MVSKLVSIPLVVSTIVFLSGPPNSIAKTIPLFESEEPVVVRIEAPLKTLKSQRDDDPQWLDGKAVLTSPDGGKAVLDIKIKARGNFRRLKSTCPFPSYWLNFKKKQVEGTVFEGQDRLKVVAHCRESRQDFSPYIYKEYLTYKAYNIITDESFKVRLASISYLDTESNYQRQEEVAFFIEHTDAFEKRLGVKQIKDRYVVPSLYNPMQLCRADLFQYLIGNTDYTFFASVDECCHNGKAFYFKDGSRDHLAVPYDFDLSGLVNAPYARPNPALKIRTVTTRVYRGLRVDDRTLAESMEYFRSKREELYALWREFEPLPQKYKKEARGFVDRFYNTIEDPAKVESEIKNKMRNVGALETYITNRIQETREEK